MINQKKSFEFYIFLIVLFLCFFDFVLFYLESILKIATPPSGMIAYLLIIPLLFSSIYDFLFKKKVGGGLWLYLVILLLLLLLMVVRISLSSKKEFLDYFIVFKCLIYFAFGYFVFFLFRNNFKYKKTFFILLLLMFFILVFNYYFQSILLMQVNHLRFAESFVFVSLFCLVKSKNKIFQQIVFFITLFSLFLLASRASFYGYLILFIFLIIIMYGIKYVYKLFFNYFVSVVGVLLLGIKFCPKKIINMIDVIMDSEILRILLWSDQDNSLLARNLFHVKGMERIKENLLLGDFKGQLDYINHGQFGAYIHDVFSYWSQFGIIVFFLFVSLILLSFFFIFKNFKKKKNNDGYLFTFIYFVYAALMIMIAKSYVYMNIYIGFGLIFHAMQNTYSKNDNLSVNLKNLE